MSTVVPGQMLGFGCPMSDRPYYIRDPEGDHTFASLFHRGMTGGYRDPFLCSLPIRLFYILSFRVDVEYWSDHMAGSD